MNLTTFLSMYTGKMCHSFSPRKISLLLLILFFGAIYFSWQISSSLSLDRKNQLIGREIANAKKKVEIDSSIVDQSLSHIQNIPRIVSNEPAAIDMLLKFGPNVDPSPLTYLQRNEKWLSDNDLFCFGQKLSHIVNLASSGIVGCWLMNAAGDTVSAGTQDNIMNFTGSNYADREYFKPAKLGLDGHQFAVGRVTDIPSLFFVSPVTINGQFFGAVGVMTDLNRLKNLLESNVFVTDEYGVIIISPDENLNLHALPNASALNLPGNERESRYKINDIPVVNISKYQNDSIKELVCFNGQNFPTVFIEHPCLNKFLKIYTFRHLDEFQNIDHDQLVMFVLLSMVGGLLILIAAGAVFFYRKDRRYRRSLVAMNEHLEKLARTDPLTGCANRRHFMEVLSEEKLRNVRYGNQFCLMSIDLDRFKSINDRYGHPAGDQVLCNFVSLVQTMLRPIDLLGRVGGEEFCILLPQTSIESAKVVAERIRVSVEMSSVKSNDEFIQYTISIGLTQWDIGNDETEDDILNRADSLLYEAKSSGRNIIKASTD